jgi:hypothetical protein
MQRGGEACLVRSVWGLWGIERDVGLLSGEVERVRGVQEVPWSTRNRGGGCCTIF